jgi:hypothetical protein
MAALLGRVARALSVLDHSKVLRDGNGLRRIVSAKGEVDRRAGGRPPGGASDPGSDAMTTDQFLEQRAAAIVADPQFTRFLGAVEKGTRPGVPREVVEEQFRASGGTVRDALEGIFARFPLDVRLDVLIADIRRVGANPEAGRIYKLERELALLRAPLAAWYGFIGEPDPED